MATPPMRDTLRGRRVLIVHEDAFFSGYITDVLADNGATIVGPVSSARQGLALLNDDPRACALVFSRMVHDDDTVAFLAATREMAMLVVQPARLGSPWFAHHHAVLTMPFAGFQVVDALHRLLTPAAPALTAVEPPQGHAP